MPTHIKFMLRHAALGSLAGLVFSVLLVWLDVAGLRHLVLATADGPLAFTIMVVLFASTFGGVQIAIAVMAQQEPPAPPKGPRPNALVPVRVEVTEPPQT
ncbi:hypothetical protein C8N43_1336 [Litoreibacter ponti]|uniref:Uncharacterized protein n=1 Tax=Litoreibacter ponti TaxID=1510457 RepID=A0A2T6BKT9_9RHOB|nr:hypothetical protein [Litoreibacter ponti]PTX56674.1 hypothetical protein C8N43_1336 [Litoreibacter ponti]